MDHVYLADNGGTDAERLLAQLQRDFPADFLTTHIEPMPHGQMKVLLFHCSSIGAADHAAGCAAYQQIRCSVLHQCWTRCVMLPSGRAMR